MANVTAITRRVYATGFGAGEAITNNIDPNPHHATDVRCQAKRKMVFVVRSEPRSTGSLYCAYIDIRIFVSPRYEWVMPIRPQSPPAVLSMVGFISSSAAFLSS